MEKKPAGILGALLNVSLRIKFLGLIVAAVLVLIVINSGTAYLSFQNEVENVNGTLKNSASVNSAMLDQMIARHENTLFVIANTDTLQNEDSEVALDYLKRELQQQLTQPGNMFDNFGIIEPDGMAINTDDNPVNLGDRAYFKEVVAGSNFAVSEPLISNVTGTAAVVIAAPVKSDGQLKSVLYSRLNLDSMAQLVMDMKYGENGRAYLMDSNGVVIAHPDQRLLLENITEPGELVDDELAEVVREMLAQKSGQLEYQFQDTNSIISYQDMSTTGWLLAVVADRDEVFAATDAMNRRSIIAIALTSLALLAVGWLLTEKAVRPINALVGAAGNVAKGELDQEIKANSGDEIGVLAAAFEDMRKSLKELMTSIALAGDRVTDTSRSLSAQAAQTSSAATANASTVTEVSATVDNMAENIRAVSGELTEASRQAEQGQEQIIMVLESMQSIEQSSNNVAQTVEQLNREVANVGQLVDAINGIAEQTNLLALNAAIEAARAGESGRGFAVVADEVRKLAEESARSAGEINHIINQVQLQSAQAVHAMDAGKDEVSKGRKVVNDVSSSLQSIMELVQALNIRASDVAAAAEQVSAAVQNVAATTEEQTAAMEEVAASAEDLNKTAEDLEAITTKYKK
ncbi:methyl-accepting chemotaxis protein [Desulfofalx alkaliphila]|uniref:methyl-accepting chemotaxis protein n=1 Tax=Desulfofalx alkaliphila TaxID=105483 RepID=UPI00068981E5|nr:methyl-accepting chemotaxis protein [Desulfofalx alkaliphila]